jgi:hypothetical protein
MKQIQRRKAKGQAAKSVLRLPDLEVAKSAVLSRSIVPRCATGYRHAFDEFVDWYCSEPRLSFNKTVGHSLPDAPEAATSRPWDDQDQIQFLLGHGLCERPKNIWVAPNASPEVQTTGSESSRQVDRRVTVTRQTEVGD